MKRAAHLTLIVLAYLIVTIPGQVSASEICKHRNLVGLFTRLASPSFDPAIKSDTEIVGGFWEDLKQLKDAAHGGDASLQAYATLEERQWMVGYGTADELWTTLNAGDRMLRDTLREILDEYHSRETPPDPKKFLAAQARCKLGRDLNLCGCAH